MLILLFLKRSIQGIMIGVLPSISYFDYGNPNRGLLILGSPELVEVEGFRYEAENA